MAERSKRSVWKDRGCSSLEGRELGVNPGLPVLPTVALTHRELEQGVCDVVHWNQLPTESQAEKGESGSGRVDGRWQPNTLVPQEVGIMIYSLRNFETCLWELF